MLGLPDNILSEILGHLDKGELLGIRGSCKVMDRLATPYILDNLVGDTKAMSPEMRRSFRRFSDSIQGYSFGPAASFTYQYPVTDIERGFIVELCPNVTTLDYTRTDFDRLDVHGVVSLAQHLPRLKRLFLHGTMIRSDLPILFPLFLRLNSLEISRYFIDFDEEEADPLKEEFLDVLSQCHLKNLAFPHFAAPNYLDSADEKLGSAWTLEGYSECAEEDIRYFAYDREKKFFRTISMADERYNNFHHMEFDLSVVPGWSTDKRPQRILALLRSFLGSERPWEGFASRLPPITKLACDLREFEEEGIPMVLERLAQVKHLVLSFYKDVSFQNFPLSDFEAVTLEVDRVNEHILDWISINFAQLYSLCLPISDETAVIDLLLISSFESVKEIRFKDGRSLEFVRNMIAACPSLRDVSLGGVSRHIVPLRDQFSFIGFRQDFLYLP